MKNYLFLETKKTVFFVEVFSQIHHFPLSKNLNKNFPTFKKLDKSLLLD
ncbi:hypothetical protein OVS_04075 [Mycoplasma ovis str. Michigan]|uniref:Uncharacterized protein n=1 Tax=Mycoplasma ovis str. Michigan TaxID=1415773 RepID=A0ABM5P2A8_9MOLU|nr:hypothetical protein OVS_04075 [Mycoplasma ovis str. Michigan]